MSDPTRSKQKDGMQSIELADTGRRTSRLGYGCSSLMGATGRRESLALLEAAFDAGIRHFDVAPMYGYGAAEGCLGEFVERHRGEVTVATKYGIPPARNQGLLGVARRVAGPVVKMLPGLKRRLARAADTVASAPEPKASFTAAEARASLEHSLRELRTERIDLWLLHEAEATDLGDEGLLRLLEDSVTQGKIGTFGAGSAASKVAELLARRSAYCRVLQFEWSVLDPVVATPVFTVHHRSLTDHFRALHAALLGDATLSRRWSEEVGADLLRRETLASVMLKASLVFHPSSIVLFSSRDGAHIRHNVEVAGDDGLTEPARRMYALVQREGSPVASG